MLFRSQLSYFQVSGSAEISKQSYNFIQEKGWFYVCTVVPCFSDCGYSGSHGFSDGKGDQQFICLGLLAGFVTCLQEEGIRGIPVYAAGVLIPCVLLLPLFYFRMLGAGDIKVFAVLGGLTGSHGILSIMFGSFLLGAVLSLAFLRSEERRVGKEC